MELGAALNGFHKEKVKDPYNFYRTQPEPVVALCKEYDTMLKGKPMLDPGCGTGNISKAYHAIMGVPCLGIDIVHRGFGLGGIDFLKLPSSFHWPFPVIMNPPFDYAPEFIAKAHEIGSPFIAAILKQQYWNASTRLKLYRQFTPKACRPLSWRLDFSGAGRPVMECQWVIWGPDVPYSHEPVVKP